LFIGDDDGGTAVAQQVSVRFGEITGILEDAIRTNRSWLSDFENDEVQISEDLYEIISAFSHLRPSA
jgi:hypothetical protein